MQNPFPDSDKELAPSADRLPAEVASEGRRRDSLQSVLTRALALFGLLPLLVLGGLAGIGDYLVRVEQADSALQAAVAAAGADLDLLLSTHRSAIQLVANEIPQAPSDEIHLLQRLQRTRDAFPALLTMLVTDSEGRIRAGSFDNRTGTERAHWFGVDVSDRDYFRTPRDTGEPAVSGVFRGRGFGEDALCAVSAPIRTAAGEFDGVVQGAIRVSDLGPAFAAASFTPGLGLVVMDPEGRVAWSSPSLGLKMLADAPEGLLAAGAVAGAEFRQVELRAGQAADVRVLQAKNALGWQVSALISRSVLLQRTLLDLTVVLTALSLMAALALAAGRRFAGILLQPIEKIASRMDRLSLARHPEGFEVRSRLDEVARLEASFARLGQRLADSYLQLQEEWQRESALRSELAVAQAEAQRAEGELDAAREIQMSMLPTRKALAGMDARIDIAALLEPMRAVGGDFFNVLRIDADTLGFFIGDVSDKGVPAALFMARTVTLLEAGGETFNSPEATLKRVGRVLARDNANGMFVTVLVGCIDLGSGRVRVASAGHDPPMLRRAGGEVLTLALDTGPALGFELEADYPPMERVLQPGDALLMFTDGLTEAEDAAGLQFGEHGIAHSLPMQALDNAAQCVDALADAVEAHRADSPADDLTVLCLYRNALLPLASGRLRIEGGGAAQLNELLDRLQGELMGAGVLCEAIHELRLIAEELISNALSHGRPDEREVVAEVGYRLFSDRIALRFEDDGQAFDPLAQNLPDVDRPIAEREIGGLGVLLMLELGRAHRYAREGGRNRLDLDLPRASRLSASHRNETESEPPQ